MRSILIGNILFYRDAILFCRGAAVLSTIDQCLVKWLGNVMCSWKKKPQEKVLIS